MPIRWDALLVRHLARELDETLAGERLRALRLDGGSRDLALLFRRRTLLWRLHPERGWLRFDDALEPDASDLRLRARVRHVGSPPDERIVRFELLPERGGRGALDLVVELVGNQLNAMVVEHDGGVIRQVLMRRERPRVQQVGARYEAPAPTGRLGADAPVPAEAWIEVLGDVEPAARADVLVRSIAWTSPTNAPALLGSAATDTDPEALRGAHARWAAVAAGEGAAPTLLHTDRGPLPYPFALTGLTREPLARLLDGFQRVAEEAEASGDAPAALALTPDLLARLEGAIRHHERRATRLRAELDGVEDPEGLRALGDLILARYGEVPKGTARAALIDFEGGEVTVELDPALEPHENAKAYYDRAGRSDRARARLPGMISAADEALARLEALRERALTGDADAGEVEAAVPARVKGDGRGDVTGPSLPYRTFRSSGGLEIRVGRGARHNDDLTFHHSSPGDVWLHARHSAGAHVVLRWPHEGAPPARDLHQAAALAALHSKARTAGSVPVDWTYRKYVRKPRGAKPGSVVPDRVSTVFVDPDEALLERLAVEE